MASINPFSSLAQLFNAGHQNPNRSGSLNPQISEPRLNPASDKPDVLLSDKNSIGISVVYQSFASKFASFSSFEQAPPSEETNEEVSFFDYEKVANNVLNFIGSSIQAAKARGADSSELETMFDQARTGVEQGFSEAKEQLLDLNLLDEELEEGIDTSRSLIDEGIDNLHQGIFSADTDEVKPTQVPDDQDNELFIQQTALSIAKQFTSDIYRSQSMSSDLTIETADGDLVTISFSHLQEQMSSEQANYGSGGGYQYMSYDKSSSSYQELNFSFSIEGSLDKEEQQAIGALIKDINKLQKEFFDGDIDKAFKQALKLGFDTSELNGFSLNLEKTTTSVASQTYQEVANTPVDGGDLARYSKPLFDFADQFNKVQQQSLQIFDSQVEQLQQLMDQVFDAEFGHFEDSMDRLNKFNHFIEQLK